jgi:hypothetical protein
MPDRDRGGTPASGWPSFNRIPIAPPSGLERSHEAVSIPVEGEEEEAVTDFPLRIADQPPARGNADGGSGAGGAGPGGGVGTGGPADICAVPDSMTKQVSGSLRGGLDMGDYYPDLAGRGYWDHGATAGPFDTGSRVGSNVQLVGTIRIPCRPDLYTLEQTVTYTRFRVSGTADANEGKTFNDIAKSGRDASRRPFRQEFMDTSGYCITMADPPSVVYQASTNLEFDRDFVTSLRGPSGSRSVSWSTSIRIAGGRVTRNGAS